jgi:hypothetical protein
MKDNKLNEYILGIVGLLSSTSKHIYSKDTVNLLIEKGYNASGLKSANPFFNDDSIIFLLSESDLSQQALKIYPENAGRWASVIYEDKNALEKLASSNVAVRVNWTNTIWNCQEYTRLVFYDFAPGTRIDELQRDKAYRFVKEWRKKAKEIGFIPFFVGSIDLVLTSRDGYDCPILTDYNKLKFDH